MPPKAKFTRDEIIEKALDIVHTEGIDRLTSRELGAQLGSSARPIFTVFESMDEVKLEVIRHARELYRQYVDRGLKARLAFQGVGVAYITFALEEPKLFQLLFMNAQTTKDDAGEAVSVNVSQILPLIDDSYEKILRSVQEPYGLDRQTLPAFMDIYPRNCCHVRDKTMQLHDGTDERNDEGSFRRAAFPHKE